MGRLLAMALKNAGWQVSLFDKRRHTRNCSFAAAGLLTPYSELDKTDLLILQMGNESIQKVGPRLLPNYLIRFILKNRYPCFKSPLR